MKSIEHRLFVSLSVGLGILGLACATAIYLSSKGRLTGKFDTELQSILSRSKSEIPFLLGPDMRPESWDERWVERLQLPNDAAILVFDTEGKQILNSRPALELELPPVESSSTTPYYWNLSAAKGESLRAAMCTLQTPLPPFPHFRRRAPNEVLLQDRPPKDAELFLSDLNQAVKTPDEFLKSMEVFPVPQARERVSALVVAVKNRHTLDLALTRLSSGIAVAGISCAALMFFIVRVSLRSGLRPLREVADQANTIDTHSLDSRFPSADLPEELQPISNRLNELMERLEAGFTRERRFSNDVAHELLTPVSELRCAAEVALNWPDSAPTKGYEMVLETSSQMQTTIESLLTLARVESGVLDRHRETIWFGDVVEDCWKPFAEKAEAKELRVSITSSDVDPIAMNSPILRILLNNLMSNAVEYSPLQGTLAIGGSLTNEDPFSISNQAPDLTSQDLNYFFDRFWRKDHSRSDATHCGLGLSICQACADALQLQLSASLSTSKVFTIRLEPRSVECQSAQQAIRVEQNET